MWTSTDYDIIVETLTGSEFEVTVNDMDTIRHLKNRIRNLEGVPVNHQHILHKKRELFDTMTLKEIPLLEGSRITLVLALRGGPVNMTKTFLDCDYSKWFDINAAFSDGYKLVTESSSIKKHIHKAVKSSKVTHVRGHTHSHTLNDQDQEWLHDNMRTFAKMQHIRQAMGQKNNGHPISDSIRKNEKTMINTYHLSAPPTPATPLTTTALVNNAVEPLASADRFYPHIVLPRQLLFDEQADQSSHWSPFPSNRLRMESNFEVNNSVYDSLLRTKSADHDDGLVDGGHPPHPSNYYPSTTTTTTLSNSRSSDYFVFPFEGKETHTKKEAVAPYISRIERQSSSNLECVGTCASPITGNHDHTFLSVSEDTAEGAVALDYCSSSTYAAAASLDRDDDWELSSLESIETELKNLGLDVILNSDDDDLLIGGKQKPQLPESAETDSIASEARVGAPGLSETEANDSKKKLRCAKCNKKLGIIMIMKCHCGKVFCNEHRYAEMHDCKYNFKEQRRAISPHS